MKLIFLDTETTGNTLEDRLCQLAYCVIADDRKELLTHNALYNPGKKIPPEASAVTHITNKMVVDKPYFKDSSEYIHIKETLEDDNVVCIAHNMQFDRQMLANDDIALKKTICTLRVARALDTEGVIPRYNLQYLRYFLEIELDAPAHDALGDVLVLRALFDRLYTKIAQDSQIANKDVYDKTVIEKMIELSSLPSFITTFTFGKHTGKKVVDVAQTDRGYLEWLYTQKKQNENQAEEEDWLYTLEQVLK